MRAEIYTQLIKLGFEHEGTPPRSEEFALPLEKACQAGAKALAGWPG
ncbi:MAG TPA: hypothetical protein VI756_09680 [Blastocatellia bacterium]